jgi:membrane protein required for colicin V production
VGVNRIDLVLAIVLSLFAIRGFWRGFSREFFGFVGLIGGLVVAAASYAAATAYMPEAIPDRLRPIAAFAAVFFAVDFLAIIVGALIHRLLGILFLSPVNRIAGAVFGVAKGAAMTMIALLLVRAYSPVPSWVGELEQSRIAGRLLGLARDLRESDHVPQQHTLRLDVDPATLVHPLGALGGAVEQ